MRKYGPGNSILRKIPVEKSVLVFTDKTVNDMDFRNLGNAEFCVRNFLRNHEAVGIVVNKIKERLNYAGLFFAGTVEEVERWKVRNS